MYSARFLTKTVFAFVVVVAFSRAVLQPNEVVHDSSTLTLELTNNTDELTNACEVLASTVPTKTHTIFHTVKSGETLSTIWSRYTLNKFGAVKAASAFLEKKVKLSALKAGEKIKIKLSHLGDIVNIEKKLEKGRKLYLEGDSFNGYTTKLVEPVLTKQEHVITGSISTSLAKDAYERGVPYEVIDSYVDLLANDIDFRRDLRMGDTFSVSFTTKETKDGEVIEIQPIESASIITKGKLHAAIGYTGSDNKLRYYDEKGDAIGDYFLRYPLQFSRISSVFSTSRKHPVLGINRPHLGTDFAAPTGTPVRSIGSGQITFAGLSGQAGTMIKIKHSTKYTTAYLHLSGIKKGLKVNSFVERGEIIGYVGSTGLSTGPHLDFRFAENGVYVDPLKVNLAQLSTGSEKLPAKYLKTVLAKIKAVHQAENMLVLHDPQRRKIM